MGNVRKEALLVDRINDPKSAEDFILALQNPNSWVYKVFEDIKFHIEFDACEALVISIERAEARSQEEIRLDAEILWKAIYKEAEEQRALNQAEQKPESDSANTKEELQQHIDTLQAEINQLSIERDALIDQLAVSKVDVAKADSAWLDKRVEKSARVSDAFENKMNALIDQDDPPMMIDKDGNEKLMDVARAKSELKKILSRPARQSIIFEAHPDAPTDQVAKAITVNDALLCAANVCYERPDKHIDEGLVEESFVGLVKAAVLQNKLFGDLAGGGLNPSKDDLAELEDIKVKVNVKVEIQEAVNEKTGQILEKSKERINAVEKLRHLESGKGLKADNAPEPPPPPPPLPPWVKK